MTESSTFPQEKASRGVPLTSLASETSVRVGGQGATVFSSFASTEEVEGE